MEMPGEGKRLGITSRHFVGGVQFKLSRAAGTGAGPERQHRFAVSPNIGRWVGAVKTEGKSAHSAKPAIYICFRYWWQERTQ